MARFDFKRKLRTQRHHLPLVVIVTRRIESLLRIVPIAILGCTIADDTGKSATPARNDSTFVPCVEGQATEICDYWWDGTCRSYSESEAWCLSGYWGAGALVAGDTPVYGHHSYVAQYGEILDGCER